MTPATAAALYDLLPAVYKETDAATGRALEGLLEVIGTQAAALEEDIARLWDDLFIETCRAWVVPYIGDLVSNHALFEADGAADAATAEALFTDLRGPNLRPPPAVRRRADVAKTIYYRRRKGTIAVLEELARDVTGWSARAVELFELLGWTQNLNHLRPGVGWTDVRSVERMDRIGGAFDDTSHSVDVRAMDNSVRHNIPNVAFFLWRLGSYPLERVPARQSTTKPWRYHFSPLGNPSPLFTRRRREARETERAVELDVGAPIRQTLFHEDLRRAHAQTPKPDFTDLYGTRDPIAGSTIETRPECSFFVVNAGDPVPPAHVRCRRLRPWPEDQPDGEVIAVDVENGRIAVGGGWSNEGPLDVSYHYGFGADLGGGPYDREKWLVPPYESSTALALRVREGVSDPAARLYPSVEAALTRWQQQGRPATTITIEDSRTYALPAALALSNERPLAIQAATRERPVLVTDRQSGLRVDVLAPALPDDPDRRGELTLGGIALEGHVHVVGDLGCLRILHSTLVPGRRLLENGKPAGEGSSIRARGSSEGDRINTQLRVEIAFSIVGEILLPDHLDGVWVLDSIVDGVGETAIGDRGVEPGPPLHCERTTVLGTTCVKTLEASDSIFTAEVEVVRSQEGCLRFSYAPYGSRTPQRYRCQPDLAEGRAVRRAKTADPAISQAALDEVRALARGAVVPAFAATRYGTPSYCQLHAGCSADIRRGAADGSEMGAFSHLKQPQREANLRLRLSEYMPFGLEPGIVYVT